MLKKEEKGIEDIIFEAKVNLRVTLTGEVRLVKNGTKRIEIQGERNFRSYINEFCGMVGLNGNHLRFQVEYQDLEMEQIVNKSCTIGVSPNPQFVLSSGTSLRSALHDLYDDSMATDLTITLSEGKLVKGNKCILAVRSPTFARLLEHTDSKSDNLDFSHLNSSIFRKVLKWIYTGCIKLPQDILQVIELFQMAEEFELIDLKQRAEEDIIAKISPENVLHLLTNYTENSLSVEICDMCKTIFNKQFQVVLAHNPDIEEQVTAVPGLMIQLFSHVNQKSKKSKKRRHVRFSLDTESPNEI